MSDPARGEPGDCLRACVATLLDHPYEQVPHFARYRDSWWDVLRGYGRRHGGDFACTMPRNGSMRWALTNPDDDAGWMLACGRSPRGPLHHVVVADIDLQVVHDPHPSRAGLLGDVIEVYLFHPPYEPPPVRLAIGAGPIQ